MAMNFPCHRSILRAIDPLVARENYIRLLGESCPIDPMHRIRMIGTLCGAREPSCPGAVAMVMGGCLWLLAVLMLHKPYSRNT
jgi:hypothetical protein